MGNGKMNQEKEHLKLVIVGHIDHGKSTLIGRLFYDTDSLPEDKMEDIKQTCEALGRELEFGFIMDHLEEEREQGITIDTAQTFFNTDKREYIIIDAPGHVEFIKNMITGASQAEAAILIVDAEEGIKEQTKRHSYVLSMLGLKQIIAVVNKMDLVDYKQERFEEIKKDLLNFLQDLDIKPNYVIPITAKQGDNIVKLSENMKWYNGVTILESLDSFKPKPSICDSPLRLPIQDIYKVGDKRINAGRIESGRIKKDDTIVILPENKITKVKSVEKYMEDISEAKAGESTGIITEDALFLDRGMVICHQDNKPRVTDTIETNIFWISKQPFDISKPITIKIATQEVKCTVEKMIKKINSSTLETIEGDSNILNELEVGSIILKTEKPVVIDDFNSVPGIGRFVLEEDQNICAGGIITKIK